MTNESLRLWINGSGEIVKTSDTEFTGNRSETLVVEVISPFPKEITTDIIFELANGVVTEYRTMSYEGTEEFNGELWTVKRYTMPQALTQAVAADRGAVQKLQIYFKQIFTDTTFVWLGKFTSEHTLNVALPVDKVLDKANSYAAVGVANVQRKDSNAWVIDTSAIPNVWVDTTKTIVDFENENNITYNEVVKTSQVASFTIENSIVSSQVEAVDETQTDLINKRLHDLEFDVDQHGKPIREVKESTFTLKGVDGKVYDIENIVDGNVANAENVYFDKTGTTITSDNVQGALVELDNTLSNRVVLPAELEKEKVSIQIESVFVAVPDETYEITEYINQGTDAEDYYSLKVDGKTIEGSSANEVTDRPLGWTRLTFGVDETTRIIRSGSATIGYIELVDGKWYFRTSGTRNDYVEILFHTRKEKINKVSIDVSGVGQITNTDNITYNGNVLTGELDTIVNNVSTNTTGITTNQANIAANTADLAINTAQINQNANDITALKANEEKWEVLWDAETNNGGTALTFGETIPNYNWNNYKKVRIYGSPDANGVSGGKPNVSLCMWECEVSISSLTTIYPTFLVSTNIEYKLGYDLSSSGRIGRGYWYQKTPQSLPASGNWGSFDGISWGGTSRNCACVAKIEVIRK